MKILDVKASKNYQITIDKGLDGFSNAVMPLIKGEKVAIITDTTVDKLFSTQVANKLKGKLVFKFKIKAGEKSKNGKNYLALINALANANFDRKSTVIALGGGVVGDLAALVASTYMRGITLISVPTTLLSSVDSSVGGKTAIDLKYGKNLCGTFYQPDAVYINTEFLSTLHDREIMSGLGEVIKYAFLDKRLTIDDIREKDYENIIYKSLSIKKDIVEEDEKESGKRMLLNFGHTVGHAIEKLSNYKLSHGICVVKGMEYAIIASCNYGYIKKEECEKLLYLLKQTINVSLKEYDKEKIISVIKKDKKVDGELVNFVFTKGLGAPEIQKISFEKLKELI